MNKCKAAVRAGWGIGAALLSGLLFELALPLGEQFYLAWVMLIPLLVAVRGRGFLWGFVLGLTALFFDAWLSVVGFGYAIRSPVGERSWNYTTFGIFGFSLATALGAWADKATERLKPWWFAALGVLLEAVLLTGLPAHLALTQYKQAPMLLVASLGGIWLVSYLIWWSNFALADLLVRAERDAAKLRTASLAALALVMLSVASSRIRIPSSENTVTFGVVQIQEPDEEKMAAGQRQSASQGAALTVWPEFSGIPFVRTGHLQDLAALSEGHSSFITCFEDDFQPLPHNVAALFRRGAEEDRYFKRKLFGGESKMHTPGARAVADHYDFGRAGLAICFDSCYPEVIRETARVSGVNVICVPSIDPVAPNNFVSAMHAAYTPFRAAENGVAMVKCDGSAYSVFVDPFGQIVKELPPGDHVEVANVSVTVHETLYKRIGDWVLVASALLIVAGISSIRSKRSESGTRSHRKPT